MLTEKTKVLVAVDALPDDAWKSFECQKTFSFVRDGIHAGKLLDHQTFDVVFVHNFWQIFDNIWTRIGICKVGCTYSNR